MSANMYIHIAHANPNQNPSIKVLHALSVPFSTFFFFCEKNWELNHEWHLDQTVLDLALVCALIFIFLARLGATCTCILGLFLVLTMWCYSCWRMQHGTCPKLWAEWKVQNCWMSKTQSSNLPCFALWPLIIDDVMMHAKKETRTGAR